MFGRRPGPVAIIPARLGSTRLPRKALLDETGTPLVVHVCQRAAQAEQIERVVVATDSEEIARAVRAGGFEAVMTSPEHVNGTSRLVEAAGILGLKRQGLVVNVQGDEPEIEGEVIDGAVEAAGLERVNPWDSESGATPAAVGTVASPIRDESDAANANVVKVALGVPDTQTRVASALYFSRAPIPHDRDGLGGTARYRHVGIYAYSVGALVRYPELGETPCERSERLEQLRWLEHGYPIAVAIRESSHAGIDTPEQYRAFVERWRAGQG